MQAPKGFDINSLSEEVKKYTKENYDLDHLYGNARKVTEAKLSRMAFAEKMFLNGLSKSEISKYLGVSEKTVNNYLTELGKSSREIRMQRQSDICKKVLKNNLYNRFA